MKKDLAQQILKIAPELDERVINLLQAEIEAVQYNMQWGLGICAVCIGGLLFYLWKVNGYVQKCELKIKDCVTYEWLEGTFEKDIKKTWMKLLKF
jgi:hypothetical protein